jgi:hypothetical protein
MLDLTRHTQRKRGSVPDEALIKEPNRAGRTMVWPVYHRGRDRSLRVEICCFMPGYTTEMPFRSD